MFPRCTTLLAFGVTFFFVQVIFVFRYLVNENLIAQSRSEPDMLSESTHSKTNEKTPLSDLSRRRSFIHDVNSDQSIVNRQPPFLHGSTSPPQNAFVIQVHNRSENLHILLNSLAKVRGIEQALVILSMDFYSDKLLAVIASFTAAPVMRILFPHSIQLFPEVFPGTGPLDCTGTVSARSRQGDCINANWFDQYQHYRSGSVCQTKHHWLWKMMFVFNHLRVLQNYSRYVIFLEEDHYVVPDVLHVLELMEKQWPASSAPGVLSLGNYAEVEKQQYSSSDVVITNWVSSKHNLGLAISRPLWLNLTQCLAVFCEYDDYNWDWSLQEMGSRCSNLKDGPLSVLHLATATRVYHLGGCEGLHHSNRASNCSARRTADTLDARFATPLLFPDRLNLVTQKKSNLKSRPNGGWADPRDVALCKSIVAGEWTGSLREWAPYLTLFSPVL